MQISIQEEQERIERKEEILSKQQNTDIFDNNVYLLSIQLTWIVKTRGRIYTQKIGNKQ